MDCTYNLPGIMYGHFIGMQQKALCFATKGHLIMSKNMALHYRGSLMKLLSMKMWLIGQRTLLCRLRYLWNLNRDFIHIANFNQTRVSPTEISHSPLTTTFVTETFPISAFWHWQPASTPAKQSSIPAFFHVCIIRLGLLPDVYPRLPECAKFLISHPMSVS